jgi:cytochrome P450
MLSLPPGDRGLPVLGHNVAFLRDARAFVDTRLHAHGPVFRANLFGRDVAYLVDPEAIRWALSAEGDAVENQWLGNVEKILGPGCTARLSGDAHRTRRRLLGPHFGPGQLEAMVPRLSAVLDDHVDSWLEAGEINAAEALRALTFEVICRYAIGDVAAGDLAVLSEDFATMVEGLFSLPLDLPFTALGRGRRAVARLHDALGSVVARRRHEASEGTALDALLAVRDDDGVGLDDATIAEELVLLLFAGHETTVTSLTNLLHLLADHPDWRAKAREEQLTGEDAPAGIGLLRSRPVTQACLDESMRVRAPIASAFRTVLRDSEVGGFRVPAGWSVVIGIASVHRSAAVWPRPERFDPGRWLGDTKPDRGAYLPFGGGPRLCLGKHLSLLETHLAMRRLLLDVHWEVVPDQDLTLRALPTPMPKDGLRLRMSRLR